MLSIKNLFLEIYATFYSRISKMGKINQLSISYPINISINHKNFSHCVLVL